MKSGSLKLATDFEGHSHAQNFLEGEIVRRGAKSVADIGGGANPTASEEFIADHDISYSLIDISERELAKAPSSYDKICVDISSSPDVVNQAVGGKTFDIVFSHMLHEHLENPEAVHRNILGLLNPGGVSIHLFPASYNLPLFMNRILPENLSYLATRIMQPGRDHHGRKAKFPAYYRLCGPPSESLRRTFESMGFIVEEHVGYVGHTYYDIVPPLAWMERQMRPVLANAGIPLVSNVKLVLRKPG
ncbi:MAG: methyltransferase domain-containing protein [Proteobacteria bacterium]|nr:methyltransferase domain-containing protein [Pseudomonadota bacterium]